MPTQRQNQQNFSGMRLRSGGGGGGFTPNFGAMPSVLGGLMNYFPNQMAGANLGAMNALATNANRSATGNYDDRDLRAYLGNLGADTQRYGYDTQREVGNNQVQGNLYEALMNAQAQRDSALAQMLGQVGGAQQNAMGQYLGAYPGAMAAMTNAPIAANAQRDVAQMTSLADILGSLIPAQLQYSLAPAQMASNERIAQTQAGSNIPAAIASMYGARQGAGADMYGSRAAADASMYGANQNSLASILASQLGYRGLQDTNNANRYLADQQLAGTALGHQLGLQGLLDTNRSNMAMNRGTNMANLGIAGIGADANKFATLGGVEQARLGLQGTQAQADANRYGSQQNALASMFQSGAGLQSTREQEASKNNRFGTAANLFSTLLGRFSTPPSFGGFRTSYGTGVTV